jgi:hypothetical protein
VSTSPKVLAPPEPNRVALVTVVAALAETPVVVLFSLMASASRRALRVLPSVAMAVPLRMSEPALRPVLLRLAPSGYRSGRRCRR